MIDVLRRFRGELRALLPRFSALQREIGCPRDRSLLGYLMLYGLCRRFRPDLIVEFGRARGNSTAVFALLAARGGVRRVVSLDRSAEWFHHTLPVLCGRIPRRGLDRVEAHACRIESVDPSEVLAGARRVFLFWDAHGAGLADHVLRRWFPLLAQRESLVLVEDIAEARSSPIAGAAPRWIRGDWASFSDEIVPLHDHVRRNRIRVRASWNELRRPQVKSGLRDLARGAGGDAFLRMPWSAIWFGPASSDATGDRVDPGVRSADPRSEARLASVYDEIFRRGNPPVILYGAGGGGRAFLAHPNASRIRLDAWVDGDPAKQGREVGGVRIRSPEELAADPGAKTIVVVASFGWREIADRLLLRGWPESGILLSDAYGLGNGLVEAAEAFRALKRRILRDLPPLRRWILGEDHASVVRALRQWVCRNVLHAGGDLEFGALGYTVARLTPMHMLGLFELRQGGLGAGGFARFLGAVCETFGYPAWTLEFGAGTRAHAVTLVRLPGRDGARILVQDALFNGTCADHRSGRPLSLEELYGRLLAGKGRTIRFVEDLVSPLRLAGARSLLSDRALRERPEIPGSSRRRRPLQAARVRPPRAPGAREETGLSAAIPAWVVSREVDFRSHAALCRSEGAMELFRMAPRAVRAAPVFLQGRDPAESDERRIRDLLVRIEGGVSSPATTGPTGRCDKT